MEGGRGDAGGGGVHGGCTPLSYTDTARAGGGGVNLGAFLSWEGCGGLLQALNGQGHRGLCRCLNLTNKKRGRA